MAVEIAAMQASHWPAVYAIYAEGIATGNATFESAPPAWEQWDAGHLDVGRLVALDDGRVAGWGALSRVSARAVYRGVAEVSIYVAQAAGGRGVGRALLAAVAAASEASGLWTLRASIFPENEASLALHRRCGFRVVGVNERIAKMGYGPYAGRWRDTLLLERRSAVVGVD